VLRLMSLLFAMLLLSSCVLTKVVTVPMRVGGAIISVIPVVGEGIDEAIDDTADVIDANSYLINVFVDGAILLFQPELV